jgi:Protein of unknown function (DUF3237)
MHPIRTPVTLPAPALAHLCNLVVQVSQPIDAGVTAIGRRRLIPITGGAVRGGGLDGAVLPGGADFQLVVNGDDGVQCATLDARYMLALDDGATVYVHNSALRVASVDDAARLLRGEAVADERVYFRCQPRFETGDARHAHLMRQQFVGSGRRTADCVYLSFWRVC